MRVLYFSKASRVAAHREKLAALSKHAEVALVVPEKWGAEPLERGGAWPHFRTLPGVLHGQNHFHLYRGLGRVLVRGAFDLVHIDEEPYSLVTAQVAMRCQRLGVPSLFFAAQNLDKRLPPPFGAVRSRVFRTVAGGIGGTQVAADVLKRAGFAGPLAVIVQMGVDTDRFRRDPEGRKGARQALGFQEGAFVVGFVGRLIRLKGVDLLLAALAELPEAAAVIVGDGPERGALERRANELGVGARVRFIGAVPSLEVSRLMQAIDALVLPSRTTGPSVEQFGRVLVEAMACEVAVVGSDSGEIPRVVGEGGLIFPENDSDALTGVIRTLASRPLLRAALGARGRARVLRLYTHERVAEATVEFYDELLSSPQRVPRRGPRRALGMHGVSPEREVGA